MSVAPKGASAVMAAKKPEKLSQGTAWEKLELFPTPPWATRAFFEHVLPSVTDERIDMAWDPCAGLGHMSEVVSEYCGVVHASDVHIYELAALGRESELLSRALLSSDFGIRRRDFLERSIVWPSERAGWIVTNPPFSAAVDMLERAWIMPECRGVAFLLRLQWLETPDRYERVFLLRRPTLFAPFIERVPMCLGGLDLKGKTATAYAWFVWKRDCRGEWDAPPLSPGTFYTRLIPRCRAALTRPADAVLARRSVPGFVPPSLRKRLAVEPAALAC